MARGKLKKQDQDDLIPSILEPDVTTKEHRENWVKLIQKIYEVDPLTCPKGRSKILSLAGIHLAQIYRRRPLGILAGRPMPADDLCLDEG